MLKESFHKYPDIYSFLRRDDNFVKSRSYFKNLIRDSYDFIIKYFLILPRFDYWVAKLYYVDGLTQAQIGDIMDLSQVAVSRRLKFIILRLKFFLKIPTLDPLQVRKDFLLLFPEELFEFAYYFYWEFAQSRVRFFIRTSQSGASNKFSMILKYLKVIVKEDDKAEDELKKHRHYLALIYLEYFIFLKEKNVINFLFKKNSEERGNLIIGKKFCKGVKDE
jgi:hypothetical protein